MKRRVLFFAEPATLAHVARPVMLASSLDPGEFDVGVATGTDFRALAEQAGLTVADLRCIGSRAYLDAVSAGRPVYPLGTLQAYVEDDLRLIAGFRPDVVVGDFRLSLAVSARLARVPFIAVSNAYWSPLVPAAYEVPVHAATRLLGPRVANAGFQLLRPAIMAQHSLPMHRLRRRHGMPSLGLDLRRVFTEGDMTLFADVPEIVPGATGPDGGRYRYIGPVVWSPELPLPAALASGDDTRPLVYVSLGSSGDAQALDFVVDAAVALGCRVAVTGPAGRWAARHGDAVVSEPMLPGRELAAKARLAVCNGGSPGSHQALQQGVPVLGIPANLDQLLNMHHLSGTGAALSLRADDLSPSRVQAALSRLLHEPGFRQAAGRVQAAFARADAARLFAAAVKDLLERART